MKVVFLGTPDYVLPIVKVLYKSLRGKNEKSPVVAVVTQKPKPVGRRQQIEYSPVDTWAHKKNIPILFDSRDLVDQNIRADVGILASYGEIIPMKVIDHFPNGILNVHPSLLPKYRGSSPVRATIARGDNVTGITIIKLNNKLDQGPIIAQYKEGVLPDDKADILRGRLFEKSAEVLTTLLPAYISGKITPRKQNNKNAILTHQVRKADAFIPSNILDRAMKGVTGNEKWEIKFIQDYSVRPTPRSILNFIHAMEPWPIAWTYITLKSKEKSDKPKRLKILKAHVKNGKFIFDEVQIEGKNPVSWEQFKQGYPHSSF